ncbi:Abi family protein [uncultured Traorella sp.]|uniref:Abi family protein n=1 Tax=uncultured Traorella sp. TaxID=1929048 RepID=UPI00341E69CD
MLSILYHSNFDTKGNYSRKLPRLISMLNKMATVSDHDYAYIHHYQKKYSNVPLWVLINVLTMGTKSVMFNVLTQDLKASIAKEFHVNPKELSQMNHVATKFRNTCAHGERLYNKRVNESIPDLPIHRKLDISKVNGQYIKGKSDLFSVVILLKYLLSKEDFKMLKKEIIKKINLYLKSTSFITKNDLFDMMGFPYNWERITRYKN